MRNKNARVGKREWRKVSTLSQAEAEKSQRTAPFNAGSRQEAKTSRAEGYPGHPRGSQYAAPHPSPSGNFVPSTLPLAFHP